MTRLSARSVAVGAVAVSATLAAVVLSSTVSLLGPTR